MPQLNLDPDACYLVAPIIGVIVGPPVTIGLGRECALIRLSIFDDDIRNLLSNALGRSFQSWGSGDGHTLPVNDPPLLLMTLQDLTPESVGGGTRSWRSCIGVASEEVGVWPRILKSNTGKPKAPRRA